MTMKYVWIWQKMVRSHDRAYFKANQYSEISRSFGKFQEVVAY